MIAKTTTFTFSRALWHLEIVSRNNSLRFGTKMERGERLLSLLGHGWQELQSQELLNFNRNSD